MTSSPATAARQPRTTPNSRLAAGIVLVLLAFLVFGVSRLVEHGQRHAYSKGATPPPTYRLSPGKTYQLSAPGGVKALTAAGVIGTGIEPTCLAANDQGVGTPVTIVSVKDDERDLSVFATFQVAQGGDLHVSCEKVAEVFVDDADNAGRDVSAGLVVLSTLTGLAGVVLTLSGAYAIGTLRRAMTPAD